FACAGSITSAVNSYGLPVTVAGKPRTSPGSAILTISVRPSTDDVESFTLPLHKMKTPRAACSSTKSVAPFGYDDAEVIAASRCTAGSERWQNTRSSRCGQVRQFSIISNPYGARIAALAGIVLPILLGTILKLLII